MLAHLRNGDTYQQLAAGCGVGVATVYRYIREAVDLLAAQAPSLTAALWALTWTFNIYAILAARARSRLGGRRRKPSTPSARRRSPKSSYHDKTNSPPSTAPCASLEPPCTGTSGLRTGD